jgi:hypothetical protein
MTAGVTTGATVVAACAGVGAAMREQRRGFAMGRVHGISETAGGFDGSGFRHAGCTSSRFASAVT